VTKAYTDQRLCTCTSVYWLDRTEHDWCTEWRDWCKLVADSFVNSQEWTLGRAVPELRLVRKHTATLDCLWAGRVPVPC